MRVGIATDHGGFGLKEELLGRLHAGGHEVVDFGANSLSEGDDYPDYVLPLAHAVVAGKVERGIAICGSGVGASVCANKVRGVRAALIDARDYAGKALAETWQRLRADDFSYLEVAQILVGVDNAMTGGRFRRARSR